MLLEVVDSPASELSDDDKPSLKLSDARIELRDVSFAYRPNEPVLNRMSFVAEPGKVTALVGPSGGGKSTVLALLLRFYEVTRGRHSDRRPINLRGIAPVAAPADRLCRPGRLSVPRHHPREHRLRQARRDRRRDHRGREGRLRA